MYLSFAFATEVVKAALANSPTQSSSMLLSQYLGGTNTHFTYLMGLRNNSTHYLQLIDTFAPCLVGKYLWNNDSAMARMCSSLHQHEFDNLFSVSDEAFILLLIDNYAARWVAEATLQKQLVSTCSGTCCMLLLLLLCKAYSNTSGVTTWCHRAWKP
jgi:hypothetical protein